MNRLLMFNCSNDLALASGTRSYIAPKSVLQMERDLAPLPAWWAKEGDAVLLPDDSRRRATEEFFAKLCPGVIFTTYSEGYEALCRRTGRSYIAHPWGWSSAAAEQLSTFGVPHKMLPDTTRLSVMRNISSRRFAALYIKEFLEKATAEGFADELAGERMRFVESLQGFEIHERTIFKSPWSSSGRGIFSAESIDAPSIRPKLAGFIKRQGGFIADKMYDKLLDFALEYEIGTDGEVTFAGYSVFVAGNNGYYGHNILASQEQLRHFIVGSGCAPTLLDYLIATHAALLKEHIGNNYSGIVGIDHLIAIQDGAIKTHPCIEINLRMNFGVAARCIYERTGANDCSLLPIFADSTFSAKAEEGKLIVGLID